MRRQLRKLAFRMEVIRSRTCCARTARPVQSGVLAHRSISSELDMVVQPADRGFVVVAKVTWSMSDSARKVSVLYLDRHLVTGKQLPVLRSLLCIQQTMRISFLYAAQRSHVLEHRYSRRQTPLYLLQPARLNKGIAHAKIRGTDHTRGLNPHSDLFFSRSDNGFVLSCFLH